jgi:hypothetical protein
MAITDVLTDLQLNDRIVYSNDKYSGDVYKECLQMVLLVTIKK